MPRSARLAEARGINFRYDGAGIGIAFDETVSDSDAQDVVAVFAEAKGKQGAGADAARLPPRHFPAALRRTSDVPDASGVQHATTPRRR